MAHSRNHIIIDIPADAFDPISDTDPITVDDCPAIPEPDDSCNCPGDAVYYTDIYDALDNDGRTVNVCFEVEFDCGITIKPDPGAQGMTGSGSMAISAGLKHQVFAGQAFPVFSGVGTISLSGITSEHIELEGDGAGAATIRVVTSASAGISGSGDIDAIPIFNPATLPASGSLTALATVVKTPADLAGSGRLSATATVKVSAGSYECAASGNETHLMIMTQANRWNEEEEYVRLEITTYLIKLSDMSYKILHRDTEDPDKINPIPPDNESVSFPFPDNFDDKFWFIQDSGNTSQQYYEHDVCMNYLGTTTLFTDHAWPKDFSLNTELIEESHNTAQNPTTGEIYLLGTRSQVPSEYMVFKWNPDTDVTTKLYDMRDDGKLDTWAGSGTMDDIWGITYFDGRIFLSGDRGVVALDETGSQVHYTPNGGLNNFAITAGSYDGATRVWCYYSNDERSNSPDGTAALGRYYRWTYDNTTGFTHDATYLASSDEITSAIHWDPNSERIVEVLDRVFGQGPFIINTIAPDATDRQEKAVMRSWPFNYGIGTWPPDENYLDHYSNRGAYLYFKNTGNQDEPELQGEGGMIGAANPGPRISASLAGGLNAPNGGKLIAYPGFSEIHSMCALAIVWPGEFSLTGAMSGSGSMSASATVKGVTFTYDPNPTVGEDVEWYVQMDGRQDPPGSIDISQIDFTCDPLPDGVDEDWHITIEYWSGSGWEVEMSDTLRWGEGLLGSHAVGSHTCVASSSRWRLGIITNQNNIVDFFIRMTAHTVNGYSITPFDKQMQFVL